MTEDDLRSLKQKFNEMSIDERIDNLLVYLQNSETLFLKNKPLADIFNHLFSSSYPIDEDEFFKDNLSALRQSLVIMVYNDLIYFKNNEFSVKNPKPDILPKGIVINAKGGWLKHIQEIKEEKSILQQQAQSIIDLTKLTKDNQKSQKDTNRTSRNIAIASVIVAASGVIVQLLPYIYKQNKENELQMNKIYFRHQEHHQQHRHRTNGMDIKKTKPCTKNEVADSTTPPTSPRAAIEKKNHK